MQRIDLALLAQQLHDDDRRRERERYRHVQADRDAEPERHTDQKTEYGREDDLTDAGHQRDGAQRPDELEIEFQPDEKQEHRNAELRQQIDLLVRPGNVQYRGSRDDPDRNETDDQRLAKQQANGADPCRKDQKRRDLVEDVAADRLGHRLLEHGLPCIIRCSVLTCRKRLPKARSCLLWRQTSGPQPGKTERSIGCGVAGGPPCPIARPGRPLPAGHRLQAMLRDRGFRQELQMEEKI